MEKLRINISNKEEASSVYAKGLKLGYKMYGGIGDLEAKVIFMEEKGVMTSLVDFPEEYCDTKEEIKFYNELIKSYPLVDVEDFLKE